MLFGLLSEVDFSAAGIRAFPLLPFFVDIRMLYRFYRRIFSECRPFYECSAPQAASTAKRRALEVDATKTLLSAKPEDPVAIPRLFTTAISCCLGVNVTLVLGTVDPLWHSVYCSSLSFDLLYWSFMC